MSQVVHGTFATGANAAPGGISDVLVVPTGTTALKLSTLGIDASNTIKTQKVTAPGTAWADQTTYNSDQTLTSISVAAGEQWRLVHVAATAIKDVKYKLSAES
jgi:hypothetical protein